jgi:basic membrane protein A
VGLVTATLGLEDHGLAQSTWQGVQRALQDGIIHKADVIESVDARDYAKNISTFAQQHYDLIITSGQALSDETRELAVLYPNLRFLGVDQDPPSEPVDNLSLMLFPEEQGGFLAGVLAAKITHTGVVAAVCETSDLDSIRAYCDGFRAGAEHENQQVKVMVTYHPVGTPDELFTDEAWGHQVAGSMVSQGADVIFTVGGRLAQGALRGAAGQGVWSIGSERDQFFATREAGGRLLTSAMPQADAAIYMFLQGVTSGQVPQQVGGTMMLAPYHEGEKFVPLSTQAYLLDLERALESGEIHLTID